MDWLWGSHPIRSKRLSFLQNFQTVSETHTLSYSRSTVGSLPGWGSGDGLRLATFLHLVLMLRETGAVLSPPLYVFIACVGKPLHFKYNREQLHYLHKFNVLTTVHIMKNDCIISFGQKCPLWHPFLHLTAESTLNFCR